jgi:hypothetical protein
MKLKILKLIVILPMIAAFSGCASIVSKSNYPVTFMSGAEKNMPFEVRNRKNSLIHKGTTPFTVVLKAGGLQKYTVTTPEHIRILKIGLDPWYLGNIIFGGPLGMIVDMCSGAAYKLPSQFYVDSVQAHTTRHHESSDVASVESTTTTQKVSASKQPRENTRVRRNMNSGVGSLKTNNYKPSKGNTRVRRNINPVSGIQKVLSRASAQASGEPHIGLVPTMKELAISD